MSAFVIADTHWGHAKSLSFLKPNGERLRPFDSVEEMDEYMVNNWNRVVNKSDTVYHLGDAVIPRKSLSTLERLKGRKILIRGNHECLDSETELLTDSGWKTVEQFSKSDRVWSVGEGLNGSWNRIDAIIKKVVKENLVSISRERISMAMTSSHRFLHIENGQLSYTPAEKLIEKESSKTFYIPASAPSGNPELVNWEGITLNDDTLRVIGWILTDGSIQGSRRRITIYQSKPENIKSIIELLTRCGVEYRVRIRKVKPAGTVVCGKPLKKDSMPPHEIVLKGRLIQEVVQLIDDKRRLPPFCNHLSDRQATVLIGALMDGDGAWNKKRTSGGLHGIKAFLEDTMAFCVTHGMNASIYDVKDREAWVLNINTVSKPVPFNTRSALRCGSIEEVKYEGTVWCIETPLSNFYARRRGKGFFTGNCLNVKEYCKHFEDVRGAFFHPGDSTMRGGLIMTHIPVHPSCLSGHYLGNIHGHIHCNLIHGADGLPDPKYFNACVEHHDFTPVPFDIVKEYFKNNRYNE